MVGALQTQREIKFIKPHSIFRLNLEMEGNSRKRKKMNATQCCRDYFIKSREIVNQKGVKNIFYRCKSCDKELNGTMEGNLVVHLRLQHTEIFQIIEDASETVQKKRIKLLLDCVELVAVNGNPFNRLLDSGLLSILNNTLKELEAAGKGVNLTHPGLVDVKEMLSKTAESVRKQIAEELTDRPLSLLVDITTKRRRSILGVSVQYIINGKHVIRSIGMLELHASHTGEYLAKVICELLLKFNIKPQQVIAITTDNGSNVLKMVRDLPAQMVSSEYSPPLNVDSRDFNDVEIENYLETVPDITDEEALNDLFDIESDDEDLPRTQDNFLNAVIRGVQGQDECSFRWDVQGIHCTPHTLQLSIRDSIETLGKPIQNVINIGRRIAKTLRLKSTAHELKSVGIEFSVPHLDVETRWCSTYIMVK